MTSLSHIPPEVAALIVQLNDACTAANLPHLILVQPSKGSGFAACIGRINGEEGEHVFVPAVLTVARRVGVEPEQVLRKLAAIYAAEYADLVAIDQTRRTGEA